MVEKHTFGPVTWIDIDSPTSSDIENATKDNLVMSEALVNELLFPSPRGRLFKDGEALCITLHFPIVSYHHSNTHVEEIDFVITHDHLITTRFCDVMPLHEVRRKLTVAQELNRLPFHSGFDLFAIVISELYSAMDPELLKVDRYIVDAEKNIYEGNQKLAVEQISRTTKRIMNFRRALQYHPEVFIAYRQLIASGHAPTSTQIIDQLIHESTRLVSMVDEQKATIEEFAETNKTLLSTHNENVMKVFTILAFITFPLTLLVSILALNEKVHAFANTIEGTMTLIGISIIVAVAMMIYFKHKKWI